MYCYSKMKVQEQYVCFVCDGKCILNMYMHITTYVTPAFLSCMKKINIKIIRARINLACLQTNKHATIYIVVQLKMPLHYFNVQVMTLFNTNK